MPRFAAPTVLIACAATLFAAPTALAGPKLPHGADRAPALPPGVVVAESPALTKDGGQREVVASTARARSEGTDFNERERPFWATVNICDTSRSPNALGVRTSVPGNGTSQRIYARYTAQWWSSAAQEWKTVGGSGVTDWVYMGSAAVDAQQAGWTFNFVQPPQGTTYVLRGVVEMQWRAQARAARKAAQRARKARKAGRRHAARRLRKGRAAQRWSVVRERTLLTETGMTGVEGGDPVGASKAMCLIW